MRRLSAHRRLFRGARDDGCVTRTRLLPPARVASAGSRAYLAGHARHTRLPRQRPPRRARHRGARWRHPVPHARPAGARPADPVGPPRRRVADPPRQSGGGHEAGRAGAGAGRGVGGGAQVPRLVQHPGQGRRSGADAAGRLHRRRRVALLRPARRRGVGGADGALAAAQRRRAAGPGLHRLHRRPGRRHGPLPGHRRHRGRDPGRHGAALLLDQRAVAWRDPPRLRP